jgi:heteromeric Ino2p/Ino4p transcription factor
MTSSPSSAKDGSTSGNNNATSSSAAAAAKARLTEQEKKNNHIASEQKRRQAIRDGFDKLAELVPGMKGQGRSENLVLQNTIDYLKKEIDDHEGLMRLAREKGVRTEDLKIEDINHGFREGSEGGG